MSTNSPRGIIPALAGNTTPTSTRQNLSKDHPRSRGEYFTAIAGMVFAVGSSPLSRGILDAAKKAMDAAGIIPALAGNTDQLHVLEIQRTDHPRSRGEYVGLVGGDEAAGGSSPLSRGILNEVLLPLARYRIIPALAGNTGGCAGRRTWRGDHPRSRGEYGWGAGGGQPQPGSSPLSRGIRPGP